MVGSVMKSATASEKAIVRDLVRSGHIDTLHSFGDDIRDRAGLDACLEEIHKHALEFPVWINHSVAPTNIWSPRRPGIGGGDDPQSTVYHADHWMKVGLVYFGRGQTTSILGQDIPPNPFRAVKGTGWAGLSNAASASAKLALSPMVSKWRRQLTNALGREAKLRNGAARIEILRSNWFSAGIRRGAGAGAITELLNRSAMEKLARSGGSSILYTHLGSIPSLPDGQRENLRSTLLNFLACCDELSILVRTTARLLDYSLAATLRPLETGIQRRSESTPPLRSTVRTISVTVSSTVLGG